MVSHKIVAIDWISLKNGTELRAKDNPLIRLLKLSDSKGCYFIYDDESIVVDIKEWSSKENGDYYYFQTSKEDWNPLTNRLWESYD